MPRRKQTRPKRMKYSDDGKEAGECTDAGCEDDDAELGDDEEEDDDTNDDAGPSDNEQPRQNGREEQADDEDEELPHKVPAIFNATPKPEASRYISMPDSGATSGADPLPVQEEPLGMTSVLSSFVEERLKATSMSAPVKPQREPVRQEGTTNRLSSVAPALPDPRRHHHRDRHERHRDRHNHRSGKSGVIRKTPSIQNEHLREIEKLISMSKPKESTRISPKSRMYPTSPKAMTQKALPKAEYIQNEVPRPKSPESLYLDPFETDQPLDLSKKPKEAMNARRSSDSSKPGGGPSSNATSNSLANLEKKFGGNSFLFDGLGSKFSAPRNPVYGAFGGNLFTTALYNTPPLSAAQDTTYKPNRSFWPSVMGSATLAAAKSYPTTPVKPKPQPSQPEVKPKLEAEVRVTQRDPRDELVREGRYTNLTCSCRKSFETLFELTIHMQKTAHLPPPIKTCDQSEYPKLVRGQDMWLNQGSEQTRQILRCMQCGESFKSLPELTIHMMNTKHYTNIVGSDTGRKQHKCSTYCEKCPNEHEPPAIKCQHCSETCQDMDSLSKHMLAAHYKRHSPLGTEGEIALRRTGRYYTDKESPPPKVIQPIENHSSSSRRQIDSYNGSDSDSDDMFECSKIRCENCLEKIDTPSFVEHVRLCVKTKPRVMEEDKGRMTPNNDVPIPPSFKTKSPEENGVESRRDSASPPPPTLSPAQSPLALNASQSKSNGSQNSPPPSMDKEGFSPPKEVYSPTYSNGDMYEPGEIIRRDSFKDHVRNLSSNSESQRHSLRPSHALRDPDAPDNDNSRPSEILHKHSSPVRPRDSEPPGLIPVLHSTTPDLAPAPSSEGSALKAMENFIERSFTSGLSKVGSYGSRPSINGRMNLRMPSQGLHMERYLPENMHTNNREAQQQRYLNPSPPPQPLPPVIKKEAPESPKKPVCNTVPIKKERKTPPTSPEPGPDSKEADSRSPEDENGQASPKASKEQYLTDDASQRTESKKGSALESLQGLVYGKSFSTEHPLDSLQKLIHNTDGISPCKTNGTQQVIAGTANLGSGLPNTVILVNPIVTVVPSNSAPPAVQISISTQDGTLTTPSSPINGMSSARSPLSEGEADQLGDFRCQACNRTFASKGSYRYHLSRCHLSSVKRYGIKEAFNMSPYVYLPLDHTAKFNKYYEMANELANKGKLKEPEPAVVN